jgi:DUF4097 and DUF4098 domain-containing protein YvlB
MTNANYRVDGDKLIITVNLNERHGPSASGKTTMIATTSGNVKLDGKFNGIHFGLNVYTKQQAEAKAVPAVKAA